MHKETLSVPKEDALKNAMWPPNVSQDDIMKSVLRPLNVSLLKQLMNKANCCL
jgi:hypothetical protein